ncbi:alginate lyase family protein [Microbulbifer donghaiensis]|nr:alginate lyase family protein [Microbulbifer donghaiensis]
MLDLRALVASIPFARRIKRVFDKHARMKFVEVSYPKDRLKPVGTNVKDGESKECQPDSNNFVLYRIIGNDLVPRHKKGQSRKNLEFILKHEADLANCEKRFIVNRIVDRGEEEKIIQLLQTYRLPYIRIPFDYDAYRTVGWDISGLPVHFAPYSSGFKRLHLSSQGIALLRVYRKKNNYVMNNNGARNVALQDGKRRAKWILPWDGNCFLTLSAWEEIRRSVIAQADFPYHIVPMARILDNNELLNPGYRPEAIEEPQVVFRADSNEEFDPEYSYGRRPKVEFLWRIGFPGKWDNWPIEPWDLPCPAYSADAGRYAQGGWVARLYSGKAEFEKQRDHNAWVGRGEARTEAIASMLDMLDAKAFDHNLNPEQVIFVPTADRLDGSAVALGYLRNAAAEALTRGPFSVVDKTTLPPGRNRNDYWHPAPYYWPHPLKIPGLPYVRRDGQRVPGTRMYEPLSEKYDRTRVQYLFDDTYTLALAWLQFGDPEYGRHGAELVRQWFLKPETAMTPHLEYAQVRCGHNNNRGACSGIIEFKDLYYFLDAVRILKSGNFLVTEEYAAFKAWLGNYLEWLRFSRQGIEERAALNNHGTYYDLQVAAICAFLGEAKLLRETLRDSRFRLLAQFDAAGAQPHELERTSTAHYCCFNLQGWIHLALIAESVGEDLWSFTGKEGNGIRNGMEWLLGHSAGSWPYAQIDEFDAERFYPIAYCYLDKYGHSRANIKFPIPAPTKIKPLYHPHDGIRPYWNLFMPGAVGNAVPVAHEEGVMG